MACRPVVLLLGLIISIASSSSCFRQDGSRPITFEECEEAGGVAWQVDRFHPDICPSCAEYRACEMEWNDLREICPECYSTCPECQERYSLHESCPECYGPCQDCQNEYLNDFENDAERFELCPDCEKCSECRTQLNLQVASCPPCIACNACKEQNKKYSDIREVCPQVIACNECAQRVGNYPEMCPGGRRKIGEISDAAIWCQCCK